MQMHQLVQDPTQDLVSYLELYILKDADDTVLLTESPEDLHKYLDTLKINTIKTKILIFREGN